MMRTFFTFLTCLTIIQFVSAQQEFTQADCIGAKVITQTTYDETFTFIERDSSLKDGIIEQEYIDDEACLYFDGLNLGTNWYSFVANEDGNLGFLVNPVPLSDYDWAVFDITGIGCDGLRVEGGSAAHLKSCNSIDEGISSPMSTGPDGSTSRNIQDFRDSSNRLNHSLRNARIPVEQGHHYVIAVKHYSCYESNLTPNQCEYGYIIDFSHSDPQIFENPKPHITTALEFPKTPCSEKNVQLHFSQAVTCAALEKIDFSKVIPFSRVVDSCNDSVQTVQSISLRPSIFTFIIRNGRYKVEFILTPSLVEHLRTVDSIPFFDHSRIGDTLAFDISPVEFINNLEVAVEIEASCELDSVQVHASTANNTSTVSYRWYARDSTTTFYRLFADNTDTVTVSRNGRYYVVAQSEEDCSDGRSNRFGIPSLATDQELEASICAGESYLFNGETLTEAGEYSVELTDDRGCTYRETLNLQVISLEDRITEATICTGEQYIFQDSIFVAAGQYNITVTDDSNCTYQEILHLSEGFTTPTVDLGGNKILFCGNAHTIEPIVEHADTYLWSDGSTGTNLTVTEAGIYGLTVSNDCNSTAMDEVRITFIGCGNLARSMPRTTTLFPNPAQDQIQLHFGAVEAVRNIQLLDLQGRILLHKTTASSQLLVDIPEAWQAGIYMVQVVTDDNIENLRFVLE